MLQQQNGAGKQGATSPTWNPPLAILTPASSPPACRADPRNPLNQTPELVELLKQGAGAAA
jgi:hypothetical protein